MKSKLEKTFDLLWRTCKGPKLIEEYRFFPARKWRADYAHLGTKTLIEIEGGVWMNGRHNRGAGFEKDAEKYLTATLDGWRVIRLTGKLLTTSNIEKIIALIRAA